MPTLTYTSPEQHERLSVLNSRAPVMIVLFDYLLIT